MSLTDIQQNASSESDSLTDEEEEDIHLSLTGKIGKFLNPKNITITASTKKADGDDASARSLELLSSQNLMSFPSATLTWGRKLRTSSDFPTGKFKVMYINTETEQELKTFIRDTITVNSSISSGMQDFGAYFIGNLDIGEDGLYEFALSQSQAKTRVILNNRVILQSDTDQSIQVKLMQGSYRIEVEFQNDADILQDFKLNYTKL